MGRKHTDSEDNEPSLELPSLTLPRLGGRRRKKGAAEDEPAADEQSARPITPPVYVEHPPHPDEAPVAHRGDRDGFALPAIPGHLAAVLTGLVVGLFGTLATYAALEGCDAATGTSSCGGPGFFLLVAVLALMVLLGLVLLKAWKVTDPGSTSFLAVGVVTVVVLLVLLDVVYSPWMFLVVPLVGAAAYALSHWVTTRFGDESGYRPPER